ncbi:hypothetical protein [Microbispora sp. NPDC049633]|uniref:hypothetical protein n=1 Tax=Microbispora sp. NPDC049633 TaxID=3154355 RepID=UPI00342A7EC0
MNNSGAIPILGQDQPEKPHLEAVPDPESAPEPEDIPVHVAFVVWQDHDGQWIGSNDPKWVSGLRVDKVAHPDEIFAGCAVVQSDLVAQKTAMQTVQQQMVLAQQARAQAANAQVMQRLKAEGKLG